MVMGAVKRMLTKALLAKNGNWNSPFDEWLNSTQEWIEDVSLISPLFPTVIHLHSHFDFIPVVCIIHLFKQPI